MDIGIIAALREDLYKASCMTKGIEIDGSSWPDTELFIEVFPSCQNLANESFARRHIAVGLEIPSTHDMPLSDFNKPLNTVEQLGLVFLNPLVENDFVMIEDKALRLFTEIGSRAECGKRFTGPFLPFPLPDWIKMCITDEMNYRLSHLTAFHS